MQVKVAVNGGTATIDIPDSIASGMSEAELTQWISQNVDRNNTRAGSIIPMADPAPYPVTPHQMGPQASPVPTAQELADAGQVDVNHFFNPDPRNGGVTPSAPEEGHTGFMRKIPGLATNFGSLMMENPLIPPVIGGIGASIAGSQMFREGSVTPSNSTFQPKAWYNPKRYFGGGNPDTLRGAPPVINKFISTSPSGLVPGAPMPPEVAAQAGVTGANPTYNQAGAAMQNKINTIKHTKDFAKNYGIKLPDVEAKVNAGNFNGALDDINKAITDHQKTTFGKFGDKIKLNYQQGGVGQVASKVGDKAFKATKNLPTNALTATGNLLNKNWPTRIAGGGTAAFLLADAINSVRHIGHEDHLEEQAEEAKKYRKFAEDNAMRMGVDSEELEAIKRLHADPETRHLLYQHQ